MASFGSSSSSSSPVKVNVWNPEQKKLWQELSNVLMSQYGTLTTTGKGKKATTSFTPNAVPAYPGQMYVPQTSQEQSYFAAIPGQVDTLAQQLADMRKPAFDPSSPENLAQQESYFENAIQAPAMRQWEKTTLPGIKEAYSGPGYWGSQRAYAEEQGYTDLATQLQQQRAELAYKDWQSGITSKEAAAQREAQFGPGVIQEEQSILGTAGQYSRQIQQEQVMADFQRWLSGETVGGVSPQQYNPFMQLIFQALGLNQYVVGQQSSSSGFSMGVKF